ncbi:FeoB-associated Cys-rich membrane protein [Bacillus sp. REN16]|nr:FeoB-associated Cys-rich membrane protein [Bacillus sp. REN16]MCC3356073.1 FeoB-associated Cys-rich membrane protein [Bacillus sp. REN16]
MIYIFLAIIVGAVSLSIFKIIRKKKLPSNEFTPFDDITMGRTEEKE